VSAEGMTKRAEGIHPVEADGKRKRMPGTDVDHCNEANERSSRAATCLGEAARQPDRDMRMGSSAGVTRENLARWIALEGFNCT
jgi:hypothetical protein